MTTEGLAAAKAVVAFCFENYGSPEHGFTPLNGESTSYRPRVDLVSEPIGPVDPVASPDLSRRETRDARRMGLEEVDVFCRGKGHLSSSVTQMWFPE